MAKVCFYLTVIVWCGTMTQNTVVQGRKQKLWTAVSQSVGLRKCITSIGVPQNQSEEHSFKVRVLL